MMPSRFIQLKEKETIDDKPANILGKPANKEQASIMITQNELNFPNLESITGAEKYEQCQVKAGYLAQVQSGVDDSLFPKLKARPVYVELNSKGLQLFTNENTNSIIRSIPFKNLGVIISPDTWAEFNCFQVLHKSINNGDFQEYIDGLSADSLFLSFESDVPVDQFVLLNLCANSKAHKNNWLSAFDEYNTKCEEQPEEGEAQKETITFQKEVDPAQVEQEQVNQIRSEFSSEMKTTQGNIKTDINAKMKAMQDELKEKERMEQLLQAQADRTLKMAQEKTKDLKKQQECLAIILETQKEQEKDLTEELVEQELGAKEETKIDEAKVKISSNMDRMKQAIQEQNAKLLEAQLKEQEDIKNSMIASVVAGEKVTGYDMCIDPELGKTETQNNKVIQNCKNMIDPSEIPDQFEVVKCLRKDQHCDYCCNHKIGESLISKITECKSTCTELLFPAEPKQETGYIIYSEEGAAENEATPAQDTTPAPTEEAAPAPTRKNKLRKKAY